MFSKSRITEGPKQGEGESNKAPEPPKPSMDPPGASTSKPKPAPSILSSDLTIKGNIKTTGDVQIEGTVEGDIRAHLLTIGEGATVKVRLTSTARVEGDIIHKTIAIESGAHFEGSVQRRDDPMNGQAGSQRVSAATAQASGPSAPAEPAAAKG